jgi:hypothetical protein
MAGSMCQPFPFCSHTFYYIKVGFKLLVYANCSFVVGEKRVYHKQILEEQTALGYIVLQKGKSEA